MNKKNLAELAFQYIVLAKYVRWLIWLPVPNYWSAQSLWDALFSCFCDLFLAGRLQILLWAFCIDSTIAGPGQ